MNILSPKLLKHLEVLTPIECEIAEIHWATNDLIGRFPQMKLVYEQASKEYQEMYDAGFISPLQLLFHVSRGVL